jgi:hypothetical protein
LFNEVVEGVQVNGEGTAAQLYEDNPHMVGQPIPSNWRLWLAYLEPRGLLRPNTEPCTCRYCRMSEAEVAEYRREVRGKHGEQR